MNINQMIQRLTEIRDQNVKSGWSERNELPMVVSVSPKAPGQRRSRRSNRLFLVDYVSSAMHGLPIASPDYAKRNALVIQTGESREIHPDKGFPGSSEVDVQPNSVSA